MRERDDADIGATPFKESWRVGPGIERVRLELEGYRAETFAVPLDRGVSRGGLFHGIFLHQTDFQRRQQTIHCLSAIGAKEVDGNRLGHACLQAG